MHTECEWGLQMSMDHFIQTLIAPYGHHKIKKNVQAYYEAEKCKAGSNLYALVGFYHLPGFFCALFCTQDNMQREALVQNSPLQRKSRLGLSSATLAFRKMSAWLLEPHESGSQDCRSEGQDGFVRWGRRGRGAAVGGSLCVCEAFLGGHPLLPVMLRQH